MSNGISLIVSTRCSVYDDGYKSGEYYRSAVYNVAFQGGNYRVDYVEDNLQMTISMVYDSIDILETYQFWLDNINIFNRYVGAAWKCSLHKSNEESLGIKFSCEVPVMGSLQNIKDYVQSIISAPFYAVREIHENVHESIQRCIDEQKKQQGATEESATSSETESENGADT